MNLDERLRSAADRLNTEVDRVPIPIAPTRSRTPHRAMAVTALVTIVTVGSVLLLLGPGEDRPSVATSPQPTTTMATPTPSTGAPTGLPDAGPLFGTPTDVVLLFDDGIDGVLAVNPDERRAARSRLVGQRAGDHVPRLHRTADHLVVGWGAISAVDLVTRQAMRLGQATMYVPAAERGRVWLVDWEGDRIGQGAATAWQVVVATGRPLTDPMPLPAGTYPRAGIGGGLVLDTDDGVALWADGEVRRRLGEGDGHGTVLDVYRNRIAWCSGDCDAIHVTDVHGGDRTFPGRVDPSSGRFSPDGRLLAYTDGSSVLLLDVDAGTGTQVARLGRPGPGNPGWSPDGEQLFATTYSYGEQTTEMLRYRLADQHLDHVTVPFGGALGYVVIDEHEAKLYFDAAIDEECPPPSSFPSNRSGICTFEF